MTRETKILWALVALLAGFVCGSMGALLLMTSSATSAEEQLAEAVSQYYADPLGFVYFAYPWGVPGTPLEDEQGPDANQEGFLLDLAASVAERGFDGRSPVMPIQMTESSGHGTGKSAMGAWLTDWILSTRPHSQGTVTAGTAKQLKTRTWAAIRYWTNLCITGHWFDIGGEEIKHKQFPANWKVSAQTCKPENAQSFAGQHARTSTSWYLLDEASRVPDEIWRVAFGGLTDGEPMMFAWGQMERREGMFYQVCFGRERNRWLQRLVDSRNSRFTNKQLIAQWIEDYGIDSDYVRVRVLGQAPRASALQYIDADRVAGAQRREASYFPDDPLLVGLDVARGGAAQTVFRFRRGLDARSIPPIRIPGEHCRDSMRVVDVAAEILGTTYGGIRPTALFIDSGFGGPIYDRLRQLGHKNAHEVKFGGESPDPQHCANMRAFMWMKMREWVLRGAIDPSDDRLETDLTGPYYHHDRQDRLVLESKDDMQKRGLDSPDDGDGLALTFARHVAPLPRNQAEAQTRRRPRLSTWS